MTTIDDDTEGRRPAIQERQLTSLSPKETIITAIAHEWVEMYCGRESIVKFLDISEGVHVLKSLAYRQPGVAPPSHCWHVTFQLRDRHIAHVLVAQRAISHAIEFMFVEESTDARLETRRHLQTWHSSQVL